MKKDKTVRLRKKRYKQQFKNLDFKLKEIESQSMNWETGIMTITRYENGEKVIIKQQVMPPKSPMYYALKNMRKNK